MSTKKGPNNAFYLLSTIKREMRLLFYAISLLLSIEVEVYKDLSNRSLTNCAW